MKIHEKRGRVVSNLFLVCDCWEIEVRRLGVGACGCREVKETPGEGVSVSRETEDISLMAFKSRRLNLYFFWGKKKGFVKVNIFYLNP